VGLFIQSLLQQLPNFPQSFFNPNSLTFSFTKVAIPKEGWQGTPAKGRAVEQ
jgi:hypothetical protein